MKRATMLPISAICLDLDDTLWPVTPVIEAAELAMHAWLAQNCPEITARYDLDSMRAVRMDMALRHPDKCHDFTFLRTQALLVHTREAGYPDAVAAAAFEVFFAARNRVEPFPDVVVALERLATRFRLLSLSNGNADLGVIGLAGYFEHSLGAREAGAAKPDRRIFTAMLERAGLGPADVVYVGDDPHADVDGARRAGLHAVWVDRFGRPWPAELEPPAHRVRDLAELADRLL